MSPTKSEQGGERFVRLTVQNPSPHPRTGVVATDWDPIRKALGLPDTHLGAEVYFETDPKAKSKEQLPKLAAQIDRYDTSEATQDQLLFVLDREHPAAEGTDDYLKPCGTVRVYAAERDETAPATATEFYTGIKFENDQLEVWLNTDSNKNTEDDHYFGGAVTSVRLLGFEMLDAFAAILPWNAPHHPDKRCMQVDRIHLVRPPWDGQRSVNIFPFRTPWRKVFVSRGPVRTSATIASQPYLYSCKAADGRDLVYSCETFRTIALRPNSDWITDEVWVKATLQKDESATPFWFRARYFMMAQLSIEACTFRYPDHPGWFSLTSPVHPNHGYGFATDAFAGALWNPPLDYKDRHTEHWAYEWELGTSRRTHSVHIFRLGTTPEDLADAVGRAWYDFSFRPIRAKLEGK